MADKPVTTVTIPEAVYETLIDLKNKVETVLAVEARRRKFATLGRPQTDQCNAELYDHLTGLQAEFEFTDRATRRIHQEDIVDAQIADDDLPF